MGCELPPLPPQELGPPPALRHPAKQRTHPTSNPTPLHSTPPNIILGQSGQPKVILGALSVISVPWQETACRLFLLLFLLRIFEETTLNRTEHAPRGFPAYFSTVPPSFPQFCLIIHINNNNSRTPVSLLLWRNARARSKWSLVPSQMDQLPLSTPGLMVRSRRQSR